MPAQNKRVHPRHCVAGFAVNKTFCNAGIERVLDRYGLSKSEFFTNGLPVDTLIDIDNVLIQRAVTNALEDPEQ